MVNRVDAAIELSKRRAARRSLIDFIRYIDPDYIISDFSISVCSALDGFILDMANGKRPVLVLGAPPQHGKSQIVSRYLPAYIFGVNPDLSVAGLSYGKDLASDMNRDIQKIMLSDEYAILFPESSLNARRVVSVESEAKRNSDTFEIVGHAGRYISQGVGGPLTGKRVDLGIIDDPIKNAKEALSETTKSAVWNWYVSTFLTRLSKRSGQIIMATRWAKDDLSGRILESNKGAKSMAFKAISDAGEALVPDLHPVEKLLETKALMSDYFWSAMYQQSPTVAGGSIFKEEWWIRYEVLPRIKIRRIYADTAMKAKEENDYSVFQCWGLGDDDKIYLLDQIRGKWESPELLLRARAFWDKHISKTGVGRLAEIKIEDKASGTGLIQQLKSFKIPVSGIPRSLDKVVRQHSAAPQIKVGNVCIPESTEWVGDYLSEFNSAPNGVNDDQIDPTLDAIDDMLIEYKKSTAGTW